MYRLADETIKRLNRLALKALERVKKSVLKFDELNVMREIDVFYMTLDANNRKYFRRLFISKYRAVSGRDDEIDELVEMFLAGLLSEPNENTHYVYDTEVLRKRDRAKESVLSVPTKAQKQLELEKALRHWAQMTGWYADFTSQGAEIQALKDMGVEKVERHELNDSKTCSECRSLDGEIYRIDKIPPLTHLRCRRWFTAV